MLAASRRRNAGGIDAGSIPCDLVVFAEPVQYRLMDTLPDTRLRPFVQSSPARHSATTPKLTRQILPWYSSPKDEQNPGQCRPVTDAWSTTFWRRPVHRQMSCNKGPEFVGNECFGQGISPAKNRPSILMPGPWIRTAEMDPMRTSGIRCTRPSFLTYWIRNSSSVLPFASASTTHLG